MYKKSCTFVLGLSKEVLSPINLLVISFSVINYVVRVRVHAGCVDAHFFCILPYPHPRERQFWWTNWARLDGHPRKGSSGGQTGQDRTAIHGKAVPVDKPGKTGRPSTERTFRWTNWARLDGHPRKSSSGGQTGASPGGQCLGLAATLAQPPDYS